NAAGIRPKDLAGHPISRVEMLVDAFGREVTDIRVSVTKRCNFGCIYCHDEGLGPILKPRMPHEDEMSVEEIERLLRVAREFGIRSVKFTGGEPLIRLDMEEIIDRSVRQIPDVSMTTNGSMLAKRAEGLRAAGLDGRHRRAQEMARRSGGQDPRARDAPPTNLPIQRLGGRGRGPRVQRRVLHELPSDPRDSPGRVERVLEPQ